MIRRVWLLLTLLLAAGCPRADRPLPLPEINPPDLFERRPDDPDALRWDETLRLPLEGSIDSLNPLFSGSSHAATVAGLLFDSLVGVGPAMEFIVNQAMVEKLVEQPRSIEVVLRPGLSWHDGAPLTAADLSFSFRTLQDPHVPVRRMRAMGAEAASDEVLGKHVWRLAFRGESPLNRWELLFPLLPAHIWAPIAKVDRTLFQTAEARARSSRPVGNGPYTLVRHTPDQEILMERWEDYPGPRPAFQKIHWRVLPDRQAALLAFGTGQLDLVRVASPADFLALQGGPGRLARGRLARGDTWTYQFVAWKIEGHALLSDPRVRQALGMALDRNWAMQALFHAPLTLASGPFHPTSWAADPQAAALPFDPDRADALLTAAGWTRDPKGWRQRDGRALAFELMLPAGSVATRNVCLRWRDELERLGVQMRVSAVEAQLFQDRFRRGAFDAAMMAWGAGVDPSTSAELFSSGGAKNFGGYSNPRVDVLFAAGQVATARPERAEAYQALHRLLAAEQPYLFLWYLPELVAVRPGLSGLAFSARGVFDFTPGLQGWWLKAEGD